MHSQLLWKVILVLVVFIKVAEPQFGLVISGLLDCIKNKYRPPSPEDVKFYLYTRQTVFPEILSLQKNSGQNGLSENDVNFYKLVKESSSASERQTDFQLSSIDKMHLKSTFASSSAPLKIIIHGYNQSSLAFGMQRMKDAYLTKGDYYVIVVDWSTTSVSLCYPRVTKALPEVGKIIAKFLDLLLDGVSLQVHLIGFSLGAHVAGYTGTFTKEKISRITGLDPASPFIRSVPNSSLDVTDAGLVDLIHTSSDFLGKGKPFGHVDFYPNGGRKQPGCSDSRFDPCSHGRAVQFFIESISSAVGFPARKCKSWPDFHKSQCSDSNQVLMGDPCPHGIGGRYFLVTGDKLPFAEISKSNKKN